MTRTKFALAAALLMSTASVGLGESPASAKRNPTRAGVAQSTPVRADQNRNMSMMPNSNLMMNVMDRASSPFACGG
jgi:hypothetical protein